MLEPLITAKIKEITRDASEPQIVTAGPMEHAGTPEKNVEELVLKDIRWRLHSRTGWEEAQGTCAMQTPDRVGLEN